MNELKHRYKYVQGNEIQIPSLAAPKPSQARALTVSGLFFHRELEGNKLSNPYLPQAFHQSHFIARLYLDVFHE